MRILLLLCLATVNCLAGLEAQPAGDQTAVDKAAEPLFPYQTGDRWGYINVDGKWVIKPVFTQATDFRSGLAAIRTTEGWCYIDRTGQVAIPGKFAYAYPFSEGLAVVLERQGEEKRWLFLSTKGETVTIVDKHGVSDSGFSEGRISFHVADDDKGGHYGFLDSQGSVIMNPISQWARRFSNGRAVVKIDGKCGYVDRQGSLVIQPRFSDADSFVDGLAPVQLQLGGKWGYIDTGGTFVINPKYDAAQPFSEGLAAVLEGDAWGFIDKTGKVTFQPECTRHGQHRLAFSDGVCIVNNSEDRYSSYAILDTEGKSVGRFSGKRGFTVGRFRGGLAPLIFDAAPPTSNRADERFVGYVRKTGTRLSVFEPAKP